CTLAQPDFVQQLAKDNVIFRIPTPLFGLGLVENTSDATLRANLAATQTARSGLGIGGSFNTNGNDNTITRFGWKAQNKSLLIFAGEAYNVEQGVSNELFPNERSAIPSCVFNEMPEDSTNLVNSNSASPNNGTAMGTASEMLSDTANFAAFIRLSAPPTAGPQTTSTLNGSTLFSSIGCDLCHSPSLTTGASIFRSMGGVTYHPFSDFALHHKGARVWRTVSTKELRVRISSVLRHCGASASACFSCMTDAPPMYCRPSRRMPTVMAKSQIAITIASTP